MRENQELHFQQGLLYFFMERILLGEKKYPKCLHTSFSLLSSDRFMAMQRSSLMVFLIRASDCLEISSLEEFRFSC